MLEKGILYTEIEEYLNRHLRRYIERVARRVIDSDACDQENECVMARICRIADNVNPEDIDLYLKEMDKPFSRVLFNYIDKSGIDDVECYKRANVDKKTFSKIKCSEQYRPSKKTAVSFAIALRLNLDETAHLLKTAGYALSKSSKFDMIIEYFIKTGNYETIDDVNEALYHFDQPTLGV